MKKTPIAIALATASLATYGAFSASAAGSAFGADAGHAAARRPPACAPPTVHGPAPAAKQTTVTTIEQAYYCIFARYYKGPVLDDRALLVPAFSALTQELMRRGLDSPAATLPALTGHRAADWAKFATVYKRVTHSLPADPAVRQAVASATMLGMVNSLNENHAHWFHDPVGGGGLGITVSGTQGNTADPTATGPLFVTSLLPFGPATGVGVKPGDEIVSVNGVPPFVNGVLSQGVLDWINNPKAGSPVKLELHRPSDGRTFTVTLAPGGPGPGSGDPAPGQPTGPTTAPTGPPPQGPGGPEVTSRLLPGDIAYVQLPDFSPGRTDQVLAAVAELAKGRTLHGVVLDLRGNTGGDPEEDARLLGAWAHGKVWNHFCDLKTCTTDRTSTTTPLLHLPLVTLIDHSCASACDAFAAAVRDLHLGKLVGARSSGLISGDGQSYVLDDNSDLGLPKSYGLGPDRETLNTIGVAPDYAAPLTAAALSAGRDPGVEKASSLLGG